MTPSQCYFYKKIMFMFTSGRGEMGRYNETDRGLWSEAKQRQISNLAEIREALVATGFNTTAKQAVALGVARPTAWVILNRDKRAGPSAKIIKRILSSPNLPPAARRKIEEYVEEKISGLYGHNDVSMRRFRDQLITATANLRSATAFDQHYDH